MIFAPIQVFLAQITVLLELLEQTTLWKVCQTLRLVLNEKADIGEKTKASRGI